MNKFILNIRKIRALLCVLFLTICTHQLVAQDQIVTYTLEYPKNIHTADTFQVVAQLRIADGFYMYGPGMQDEHSNTIVSNMIFTNLHNGFKKVGVAKMKYPDGTPVHGKTFGNRVNLEQLFICEGPKSNKSTTIKGVLMYQVCNEMICNPPVECELECFIKVVKNKLAGVL